MVSRRSSIIFLFDSSQSQQELLFVKKKDRLITTSHDQTTTKRMFAQWEDDKKGYVLYMKYSTDTPDNVYLKRLLRFDGSEVWDNSNTQIKMVRTDQKFPDTFDNDKVNKNAQYFKSEKAIGGIEAIGGNLKVFENGKEIAEVTLIMRQEKICINKTIECVGLPMIHYGMIKYGMEKTREIEIFCKLTKETNILTFTGKVSKESVKRFFVNDILKIKFYDRMLEIRNKKTNNRGDFVFELTTKIPSFNYNFVGSILQIYYLHDPSDKNSLKSATAGFGKINSYFCPYYENTNASPTVDDPKEVQQPIYDDDGKSALVAGIFLAFILLGIIFCSICQRFRTIRILNSQPKSTLSQQVLPNHLKNKESAKSKA